MDGDMAPLEQIARICAGAGALLMVDDAHGFVVLGNGGRGSLEEAGLNAQQVPVLVGTFGKALGTAGAFVAGSALLIENLIQFARPYIYTTAPSPALAVATSAALGILAAEPWRRARLHELIVHFRARASALRIPFKDSTTPIQPLILGESRAALAIGQRLRAQGVLVAAIRPPTVPRGGARLRITLSAAHGKDDVELLLNAIADSLKETSTQCPA